MGYIQSCSSMADYLGLLEYGLTETRRLIIPKLVYYGSKGGR